MAQARGLRASSRRLGDWRPALLDVNEGVVDTGPLLAVAREAFTHSLQVSAAPCAAIVFANAGLAAVLLRRAAERQAGPGEQIALSEDEQIAPMPS